LASKQREEHQSRQRLLRILLEDEADRLRLWLNPLLDPKRGLPSAEFQDVEVRIWQGCRVASRRLLTGLTGRNFVA
jgi:hypothetical protein